MIYEFAFELNGLKDLLCGEIEEIVNDILDEYNLTVDDLYNMTPEELISVIFTVAVELFGLNSYEIISEQIEGNSATVTVMMETETEITLVKQDGLWKIRFDI